MAEVDMKEAAEMIAKETGESEDLVAARLGVMLRFLKRRGGNGARREEIKVLLEWVGRTVLNGVLLELVLQRKVDVDVVDGEPVWMINESYYEQLRREEEGGR